MINSLPHIDILDLNSHDITFLYAFFVSAMLVVEIIFCREILCIHVPIFLYIT